MRLIDADALWNALNDVGGTGAERGGWADGWCKAIDAAIRMLEKAPTVEPEPQWIPVAERLPETSQDVLITKRKEFGTVRVMKAFYISSDDEGIWVSERGTDTTGVIAWMPLPEPYKGEHDD